MLLITKDQTDGIAGLRISAEEIDQLVTSRVRQWLVDPGSIYQAIPLADASPQHRLIARAGEIGKTWSELPGPRQRAFLTGLLARIDAGADQIDIHLRPRRVVCSSVLQLRRAQLMTTPRSCPCRWACAAPGGKSGC